MKAKSLVVALTCLLLMVGAAFATPDAAPTPATKSVAAATTADAAPAASAPAKAAVAPTTTKAKAELKDVPEAVKTGERIWTAFKDGKYREAIAGVILMLLFLWRRFASKFIIGKLSNWQVGFVAVLLGFLGTIPEALAVEPWSWKVFLYSGLATSGEAIMFWKTLGQKILPKVFGALDQPLPTPPEEEGEDDD